jgi:hypothetical protein
LRLEDVKLQEENILKITKGKEANKMLSTTRNNRVIRNYIIVATSVMFLSVLVADFFDNSIRIARQDRLENYDRFISFRRYSTSIRSIDRPIGQTTMRSH